MRLSIPYSRKVTCVNTRFCSRYFGHLAHERDWRRLCHLSKPSGRLKNVTTTWMSLLFFFVVFCSRFHVSLSHENRPICSAKNETSSRYAHKVNKAFATLSDQVSSQGWGIATKKGSKYSVFGLAQCYEEVSTNDCARCFNTSRTKLKTCSPPAKSARIHLDQCYHRIDDYDFFKEVVDPRFDHVDCGRRPIVDANDTYMCQDFNSKLDHVIMNVKEEALAKNGYGATEVKVGVVTIYALAQCWKTIDANACKQCLDDAGMRLRKCGPGAEGRAMFTGCYMKYSTNRFYNLRAGSRRTKTEDKKGFINWVTFGIAISVIVFLVLAIIGALISYKKLSQTKQGINNLDNIQSTTGSNTSLNFKYELLERATESFHDSMKLGQGGAGSVFKGILPNNQVVAVKRLFFNTRQWVDQFFNEVTLISGIQHKNLVRLLGCSIEGPESLLVYEYVPNRSLDHIIFSKGRRNILSWSQRFNIVCGTAEGLAYLHGGSGVKILHRDIKAGNILLDENLSPKIADFGLARCVASDKSHVSTAIAGTLGYMAPEYLVRGQLTEKADVYAFGVLLIEIATGRKNSVFSEGSSSILHTVWEQYKANKITQAIDPGLQGNFEEKEASVVLLVGLLCTQPSVRIRPSMSEVVQMLTNVDCEIPCPKQPPFLNASVLSPEQTVSNSILMGSLDLDEEKTSSESFNQKADHGHMYEAV